MSNQSDNGKAAENATQKNTHTKSDLRKEIIWTKQFGLCAFATWNENRNDSITVELTENRHVRLVFDYFFLLSLSSTFFVPHTSDKMEFITSIWNLAYTPYHLTFEMYFSIVCH